MARRAPRGLLAESGITFRHRFIDSETGSSYRINPYDHGSGVYVADVTAASGIVSAEWNGDVAVADIDLDGDLDLYTTSNMFGTNHLFRNQGDGTFQEITGTALRWTSWGAMGAKFFDADGDGTFTERSQAAGDGPPAARCCCWPPRRTSRATARGTGWRARGCSPALRCC